MREQGFENSNYTKLFAGIESGDYRIRNLERVGRVDEVVLGDNEIDSLVFGNCLDCLNSLRLEWRELIFLALLRELLRLLAELI